MKLSQKRKILSFFFHFKNFDSIFKIFQKKMTVIGGIVLNLRTPKNVVR